MANASNERSTQVRDPDGAPSASVPGEPLRILLDMVGERRPNWGGMQRQVYTLGRHLAARGHQPVLLVQLDRPNPMEAELRAVAEDAGIRLVTDARLAAPTQLRAPAWRSMPALGDVLRRERIDIYHIHTSQFGNELWTAGAACALGYMPIMTYHTLIRPESWRRRAAMRVVHRYLPVKTVGVSHAVCDSVQASYQPRRGSVVCVLNGIDEPEFAPAVPRADRHEVRVAVLGRFNPDKGFDTFIAAMGEVDRSLPVRATLIGDGPLQPMLQARAEELGSGDRVEFQGYVPDAGRLLPQFDLVVVPSRSEAFSLVVAEAFAAGLPVVATQIGGLRELVCEGENGWLVAVDDAPGMARAIESAARDPDRRRRMGAAGRRFYEAQLRADLMTERMLEVYRGVLSHRARSR